MDRVSRCVLAILNALDGLARRSPAEPPRASPAPADPEPETITELLGSPPCAPGPVAPPGNPRVLGHMLVCPGVGAVAWVGVGVPREGRDGAADAADAQVGWARKMPVHIDDVLVVPTDAGARSLLWAIRFAVPPTTEVLPVIVGTGPGESA